jgi:NAD-dependent DNA ligase
VSTAEETPKKIKIKKKAKTLKKKTIPVKSLIKKFQDEGIDALKTLTEKELSEIVKEANAAYTNQNPIMSDNEYDIVKEYVERKFPKNIAVKEVGAPAVRNKVSLPYAMPSMDKIKPDTGAVDDWKKKYSGPYVLSAKLDGVSGLYTTEGPAPKLYTRGNGTVGQDISHMIPFLKLPTTAGITIRGEFIMPKAVFERKYKGKFANARNLTAGIINKLKKIDPQMIRDLDFVAYEVLQPELKPSEQMKFLDKENVDAVIWKTAKDVTNETLSELLVDWRKNYVYEIDGVIVADDQIYPRIEGNPEHAFAFKMMLSDQVAEAKVVNVNWIPSKDGYLIPVVEIEPVVLGGATIKNASAYNAAFIEENKIGIGALVKMIRSGDVIPKIEEVIEPASKPKMPDVPYVWNATHVDVLLKDKASNEMVKQKAISSFFKKIDVEHLGEGNVKRIMAAGYNTVPAILAMTEDDFLDAEGFKKKLATKVYNGIKAKIDSASLPNLMAASNVWGRGFGEKKLRPILEAFPDILTTKESDDEKEKKVLSVKGMATKSAHAFVDKIPAFLEFIEEADLKNKLKFEQTPIDKSDPLYEKRIVFTGVRDKELENILKEKRAKVASSVNKDTFVVIVKDVEDDTGKAEEARKLGIPLMTIPMFKKTFEL